MNDTLDFGQSYEALHRGTVQFSLFRDVVRVQGPDALSYLEGQCSQHISELRPGENIETLLLSPQGKIEAYAQVVIDGDGALLVVDEGWGEITFERLRRFKLRVKAEFELVRWPVTCLRGVFDELLDRPFDGASIVVDWPGCRGVDLLGPSALPLIGIPKGDPSVLELARIEAGIPAMGRELTEKTIPQESGIVERSVSFTKGCYTGQELVARIDARGGRVPRRLRGVVVDPVIGAEQVGVGDVIMSGDKDAGSLTSLSYSPRTKGLVGLGYVRRDVTPPIRAVLRSSTGDVVDVMLVNLPLINS